MSQAICRSRKLMLGVVSSRHSRWIIVVQHHRWCRGIWFYCQIQIYISSLQVSDTADTCNDVINFDLRNTNDNTCEKGAKNGMLLFIWDIIKKPFKIYGQLQLVWLFPIDLFHRRPVFKTRPFNSCFSFLFLNNLFVIGIILGLALQV